MEVAVVATKRTSKMKLPMPPKTNTVFASSAVLMLAACALSGLISDAHAEGVPEKATFSAKILSYHQNQPDAGVDNKAKVTSPSVFVSVPIAGQWVLEGSLTHDNVSGASPRYHTSGASHMSDERTAGDIRLKRYFDHGTVGVGLAHSTEHDYKSTAVSVQGTYATNENNTTWSGGVGFNQDSINPVNQIVVNEKKRGYEMQVGVTQVLTPVDIAQVSFTYSNGSGYFSDPYKPYDNRPRNKDTGVLMAKWNHHFKEFNATTRVSYRYYDDSFGVIAHTATLELVKPLGNGWTVTPNVRYYTQNKARFYRDPPFPNGSTESRYYTTDQRMANTGAITVGVKVSKQITPDSTLDFKIESYQQRSGLHLGGSGSPGLSALKATMIQIGYSHQF